MSKKSVFLLQKQIKAFLHSLLLREKGDRVAVDEE